MWVLFLFVINVGQQQMLSGGNSPLPMRWGAWREFKK